MTAAAAVPEAGTAETRRRIGALSRLIREVNEEVRSLQRLADRTYDPATGRNAISKPYLEKLTNRPPAKPPTEDDLRAIAVALRKPLPLVQQAAAEQWLGLVITEVSGYGTHMRRIVAHLERKSPEEQARWLAMMEASEQAQQGEG